jgi:predicted molibdopterin-dependent oxidoreductase YjgC
MTRRSKALEAAAPHAFIEINENDAAKMEIQDSEPVTVTSRRGSITLPARLGDRVGPGVVFIPFHYKEAAANLLTNNALDPISKIAEAKVCAVKIDKIEEKRTQQKQ